MELAAIPAAIRDYRRQRHLTQAELGARIGAGKDQISKLERNALNVTIDTLQKVLGALGTTVKIKLEPAG